MKKLPQGKMSFITMGQVFSLKCFTIVSLIKIRPKNKYKILSSNISDIEKNIFETINFARLSKIKNSVKQSPLLFALVIFSRHKNVNMLALT